MDYQVPMDFPRKTNKISRVVMDYLMLPLLAVFHLSQTANPLYNLSLDLTTNPILNLPLHELGVYENKRMLHTLQ